MKIHPLLMDPNAVLISRQPLSGTVSWDDFRAAARRIMEAMQIELEGENVVFKPNGTIAEQFADPDTGITTHPGFIHGGIEYLFEHGSRRGSIYILEDPRNSNDNIPRHWKDTGFPKLRTLTGAKLRCPNSYTCTKKKVPNPQARSVLPVSRLATAENSVLINVPKLKTHNLGITTLCMKNLMGAVNVFDRHFCSQAWQDMPEAVREQKESREQWMDIAAHEQWQVGLAKRLIDLAQVVQPQLNIVEGVVARDGTGFNRGSNHTLGLSIAGTNMVAVDSVASYLMGFDPQKLIYLKMANEAGLGSNALEQLHIYTVEDGDIVPCQDIEPLRTRPPLRVISGIKEDEDNNIRYMAAD
ncbi:MAG: DUF362 domain-containing protein [Anaerolineae bacterium]|nr:DUF362 domain-containing protein [Anaerolineae bacterium]